MALGFKLKTVRTSQSFANVIVFPPLDRQNQVWVMVQGKNKILIQKNQMVGVGDQLVNAAFDTVTHGIFSIGSVFGGNVKEIERLVEATASELEALNL